MPIPLSPFERNELLKKLGVGDLPSPEKIRDELEQEWLLPSVGGRKELESPDWAVYVTIYLYAVLPN